MSKTTKTTKKISFKKGFQQQIIDNLGSSLTELKEILGEKKFRSRVKKAAKLLSEGIKEKTSKKIKEVKKNTSKKKTEDTEPTLEK